MKLALVNLSKKRGHPPLGLAYIPAYLREYLNFDDVVIIDKERDPFKKLKRENPDLVGISAMTVEIQRAKKLAERVKSDLDVPLILGGVHISTTKILPKQFDVGIIGEGEQTMLELMQLFEKEREFSIKELKKIDGIIFDGHITKPRKLIRPLDEIPFPARDLLKMEEYYLKPRTVVPGFLGRSTSMFTSRGCPYRCVFCATSHFWKTARFHSPEYVIDEILELIEKYRVRYIAIADDLLVIDRKRFRAIHEMVKREKINERVAFHCQLRSDTINEEICRMLREMNVVSISFGFESGSDKILRYLKKNTTTVEQNKKAAHLCKKFGIVSKASFMIGNPQETKEDLERTLQFIKNVPFDIGEIYITTPYPGTELWNFSLKGNLVSNDMNWDQINQYVTHNLDGNIVVNQNLDKKEIYNYYLRMKKILETKNISNVHFKVSDLLDFNLLKRAFKSRSEALKYLKNRITN